MERVQELVEDAFSRGRARTYDEALVLAGLARELDGGGVELRDDLRELEAWIRRTFEETVDLDPRGQVEHLAQAAEARGWSAKDCGVVYAIVNASDDDDRRVYIGKTRQTAEKRFLCHPNGCKLLENAFGDTKDDWEVRVLLVFPVDARIDASLFHFEELLQRLAKTVGTPIGLNACYGSPYFAPSVDTWIKRLCEYVSFVSSTGSLPVRYSNDEHEKKLALWASKQRSTRKTLPSEYVEILNTLEISSLWNWILYDARTPTDELIDEVISMDIVCETNGMLFPSMDKRVEAISRAYKCTNTRILTTEQRERIEMELPGIPLGLHRARLWTKAERYTKGTLDDREWAWRIINGKTELDDIDMEYFEELGLHEIVNSRKSRLEREENKRKRGVLNAKYHSIVKDGQAAKRAKIAEDRKTAALELSKTLKNSVQK